MELGNVAAVQKKFSKAEFLGENKLFPRDLRKIDSSNIDVAPIIAVREDCILINMLHIKALIKDNEVMIFDTSNPEYASKLSLFMYDLGSKLRTKVVHGNNLENPAAFYASNPNQPYEFRALECILVNVMAVLEGELQHHSKVCTGILAQLDKEIDRAKLRDLLVHSKSLTTFYQKSLLIRNALDELLDNDDDLESLYLTENKHWMSGFTSKGQSHSNKASDTDGQSVKKPLIASEEQEVDTGEVEMLLEAYYKQCDEIVQQAETLINNIKSTEEIVNIILDANRNSLMVYELKISIYTLGFTVATLLPAFYGMNLKNYTEESTLAFVAVVALSCLAGMTIIVYAFRKLRLVQKMSTVSPIRMNKLDQRIKIKLKRLMMNRNAATYNSKMRAKKEQQDVVWRWLVGDKYRGK
ncbi:hypothetical protein FOA43_001495 [Brettanomyces nanus]|uniref:Magnesium transporter n=1 Tax=Eeniella nana TaxID=13502 RepID=A0A875RXH6_EENNA|nr:uncharacterized protein FOA43_001495 [Brettanomyces nanus]QPG74171.1 hypothetical protein FOA43_001495 [Brettanomyces nanus]